MALQIGIIGLPNVGKSTLFNALVKSSQAEAANYPFCTVEPNVGIVEVPDPRLNKLAETIKPPKKIPAVIEFIDIAGLAKGAHKGEGLGNQFLSHIRECDAILEVVRFFEDKNIAHSSDTINPSQDIETIKTELILKDIETVNKLLYKAKKDQKIDSKEASVTYSALNKLQVELNKGKNAKDVVLTDKEAEVVKNINLLTSKPMIFVANVSEDQLKNLETEELKNNISKNIIMISAKIESEINELDAEDQVEYLETLGVEESGLNKLIKKSYKALNLITFFSYNDKELRAWTVPEGAKAPQAAGVIHSDFEKGFVAAEVIGWLDLVNQGSWQKAREHGLIATCGKNYVVQDGDVCLFRFNK